MSRAEERLVPADRFAFVVEDGPTGADPPRVDYRAAVDDSPGLGLNLHQSFTEPRPFDLVLWVQGTAATPYLQKGLMTTPEVWQQMLTAFGDELPGYALWFN